MVQIDKSLEYKRESHTASFTLLMWNLSKDDLIAELKHKLAKNGTWILLIFIMADRYLNIGILNSLFSFFYNLIQKLIFL